MRHLASHIQRGLTFLALVAFASAYAQEEGADDAPVVLTGTQATYSIATALSVNTDIRIINIPEDGREFALLKPYLERRKERLEPLFASATAVIALTNALPADPLYRYARAANVGIVNIDAALPWTYDTPGVSLIDAPRSDVDWMQSDSRETQSGTSPFFWLSISNTIRMADIVASDLQALFPAFADTVALNLDDLKTTLLEVRRSYQERLLSAGDDTVFALTGDFAYLTSDLGLFVDGYFIKQDVDWTPADLAALTAHLHEHGIRVVLHKWLPDESIQAAVHAAGAQLVVLETGDQGRISDATLAPDGLQQILTDNMEKISDALEE